MLVGGRTSGLFLDLAATTTEPQQTAALISVNVHAGFPGASHHARPFVGCQSGRCTTQKASQAPLT